MHVLRNFHESLLAAKGKLHGGNMQPSDADGSAQEADQMTAADVLPALEPVEALPSKDPLALLNAIHQVIISAGLNSDLSLPMITVMGSQSVGKTSVLESLVGRDFLPRGTGIVTRRPLVLQLRQLRKAPGAEGPLEEWAEFEHKPKVRFRGFDDVRKEIDAETLRLCGRHRVSEEPILLQIFSPSVMDLTLVDLPGLTKVPTADQPKDMPQKIRDLVKSYVGKSTSIILAISAANVDLATSDALALAREVDPNGLRTVGVLTKFDLDDAGNSISALLGEVYPLRLGYTAVVCRSEAASQAGVSFEEALKAERDFFARHPKLAGPLQSQCGIPNLAQRLQVLLLNHIREALPTLRSNMQRLADSYREELQNLGDENLEKQMGQGPFLLHLISSYVRNFSDLLEGRVGHRLQEAPPAKLVGGARIHHIFHRVFAQAILDFDAFTGLSDLDIRVAMRNAAGPKPQLFVPEMAFERMVKRQIQKLEEPALQCVLMVDEELKHLASQSEGPDMQRFAGLREKLLEVTHAVIRRALQPASTMVSNLIRIEREYINVDHPDFIGGLGAMSCVQEARPETSPRVPASTADSTSKEATDVIRLPPVPLVVMPAGAPSEKEHMDTKLLKSLLLSYFTIVKRKLIDSVPKTIMHFMVNKVQESLHAECIAALYKTELFTELFTEAEEIRAKRQSCEAKLLEVRKAQELLVHICDAAAGAS